MNFKPNIKKIVLSVVIGVISFFLYNNTIYCDKGLCYEIPLITAIILTLLVYLIWSLIQKKS